MNFFEQQDRAKRQSGLLLLLMTLAVLSLITLISLAIGLALRMSNAYHGYADPSGSSTGGVDWALVGGVALAVIAVVSLGSLYKSVQMSRGGKVVAQRLGGRLINLEPQTFEERRLLNVVEEMAIAAGTPVPAVYVLDDLAINAFAAGLTPQDAVIGVTRGAIELLSREELQGVIAHEFSHIFHGDMRLNMRLISLLHGILLLGLIGGFVLRGMSMRSSARSSRDNSALVILAIGGTLLVLGYAGTFFGNLIKAAVSRQREFLADASAVQYTRNPESIGGALKKIGGFPLGSQLQARNAAEFSHLYFGQGIATALGGWLATHPPLAERIRRVDPGWDGQFPSVRLNEPAAATPATEPPAQADVASSWDKEMAALGVAAAFSPLALEQSIEAIGEPQPAHLQQARSALQRLGTRLTEAAHDCIGAQALAYGLMLGREPATRMHQLEALRPQLSADVAAAVDALDGELSALGEGLRLPLLELAMPALKQLSKEQWAILQRNLIALAKADRKIELLEWTLLRILQRNIEGPRPLNGRYHLLELADESALLLSALAHAGHAAPDQAAQAFARARAALPFDHLAFADQGMPPMQELDKALGRLNQMWPLQKPRLLKAMACSIEHDGQVTDAEAELMRAVADMLDCPMPPFLTT